MARILRRDQGSLQSQEAGEIIHRPLMNGHSLGKNRLKRKQETRSKGHWVELGGRPGSVAESWCCREILARARTSSRKARSPEEKPAKEVRIQHRNGSCNCEFAQTELARDKTGLFSFQSEES